MTAFSSVKIVGGLLPADLFGRIFAGDSQVPGTAPGTYGLERGESVRRQASRSWLYLLEVWQDFKSRIDGAGSAAADATSARVTRERWLRILLRELGFHEVAGGSFELAGKSFPVSHRSGYVPIHLLGWATDLDHKTPHVTARAPQSMLQELLNRDDAYLWAILSNGTTLRLLRDSTALVGSSYVEFDLEAIFDGELFSDFVLLYLACHESRFARQGEGGPETCYLEQWRGFAVEQGQRALDQLRDGVQRAISILGTGFLSHPDNPQLRVRLDPRNADLKLDDFNRALLRLVYRILFWLVAEDRGALLQPDPADVGADARARLREARERYAAYFSAARLRQLARRHRGGRHGDLFEAMQLVFSALGTEGGVPELALPGIGGIFESRRDDLTALPLDEPLDGARLSNEALLDAMRALSQVRPRGGGALRRVDFGNLGAEELGSVYESLLELIPRYDGEQPAYTLETLAGNERKESGSYYTPTALVECLLDSALDPLLDEACAHGTTEERVSALLNITVCDPACGSGHFLVAAARRIAKRIAAEETGESEPPDAVVRTALRRVVGRCIYGVDVNPMAAELAKVSLWIEALEPGKPLSYLDRSIRVGNSLLGVTPALLAEGLPDVAFTPIEGDDRKVASALKKQNAAERDQGQYDLFSQAGIPVTNAVLAKRAVEIARALPDSLEDLHIHQQRQALELAGSPELRVQKLLADAWCAAFVQPKTAVTRSTAITQATLEQFGADTGTLELAAAEELVLDLTRQFRFFHWHIEFPHIFRVGNGTHDIDPATSWVGGFSCVVGNPPWDQIQYDPREFFASRDAEVADSPNMAERDRKITRLKQRNPALFAEHEAEQRHVGAIKQFVHSTGRFPLTSYGRLNTSSLFSELSRTIIGSKGRSGQILPTGIATDSFNQYFFRDLVERKVLAAFYDFENEAFLLSRSVHHSLRFCLLTVCGRSLRIGMTSFAFGTRYMRDLQERRFAMPPEEILLVNPNTGTIPVFRSREDAVITTNIYKRVPILWRDDPVENSWGLSFRLMFMMNTDSYRFRTLEDLQVDSWRLDGNIFTKGNERMLPLYEAKMIHHFDHRLGTYEGQTQAQSNMGTLPRLSPKQKADPDFEVRPRYWLPQADVDERLSGRWAHAWLIGWREICRSTDERTMICSLLPRVAVGNKIPIVFPARDADLLLATWSSFVVDYTVRQKMTGTSMSSFILKQIPVPHPDRFSQLTSWDTGVKLDEWIRARVVELTSTAWGIGDFGRELGYEGPPFLWDEGRRTAIRTELDAAFFHIYGLDRDEVDHIMDSFAALRRREEKAQNFGEFRTKRLILERYDAMAEAIRTGQPYQTILDPPPGHGPRHPERDALTGADRG
jgi:N-6 DNA Methylase